MVSPGRGVKDIATAGVVEVVTKLNCEEARGGTNVHANDAKAANHALWSHILSGLVKDPCHFGCTEHVCDALEVVCHGRETNFDFRAGKFTKQETRVSKNPVLDRRKGVLDGRST